MRRPIIVIVSILLCLLYLCSCSTDSTTYQIQEKIGMNYNNINNHSSFWLTNDSICFLRDSLIQEYFLVDKDSKTKIGVNSGHGSGKIQRYGNNVYMLDELTIIDECNSKFELKIYNVNTKTIEKLCSIKNCDNFWVLNESIYYLEYNWINDVRTLTLKKFLLASKEHTTIRSNVISFGVVENGLYYVIEENDRKVIYKYNAENGESVKCGEFSLEEISAKKFNDNLKVSYTSSCVFFSWVDYENETSTILKYSFQHNTLSNVSVDGYIDGFVSYDTCSYFITSSEQSENSGLYKMNNDTNEFVQIVEFLGNGCLFVGSNKGAYVLEYNDNILKYYSNEGDSQVVCRL